MEKIPRLGEVGFIVYNGRLLRGVQDACVQLPFYKRMGNKKADSFKGTQL